MANDIYTTTLGGLSELVSPRVAQGVLDRALRAVDRSADDVDARLMSRLLRGRIRSELERSLPPRGLRRSLARIERRMLAVDDRPWKARKPGGRPPEPAAAIDRALPEPRAVEWRHEPADDGDPAQRVRAFPIAADLPDAATDAAYDPWPAEPAGDPPAVPGDVRVATAGAPTGTVRERASAPTPPQAAGVRAERSPAAPSGSVTAPAAPRAPVAPEASAPSTPRAPRPVPASAIDRLAALSGVRQWVWTSEGTVQGQGEGPDPATVAGDVRATIALLSRHGRVASLHVHHDAGHVLVGVRGRATLVVSGDEGVNLGAVYTTFRALEEAP